MSVSVSRRTFRLSCVLFKNLYCSWEMHKNIKIKMSLPSLYVLILGEKIANKNTGWEVTLNFIYFNALVSCHFQIYLYASDKMKRLFNIYFKKSSETGMKRDEKLILQMISFLFHCESCLNHIYWDDFISSLFLITPK